MCISCVYPSSLLHFHNIISRPFIKLLSQNQYLLHVPTVIPFTRQHYSLVPLRLLDPGLLATMSPNSLQLILEKLSFLKMSSLPQPNPQYIHPNRVTHVHKSFTVCSACIQIHISGIRTYTYYVDWKCVQLKYGYINIHKVYNTLNTQIVIFKVSPTYIREETVCVVVCNI